MNLNKKILDLRGEEILKSLPSQRDIEKLPKTLDNQPDLTKLEKETIGNVIFNCLSGYVVADKKEGWYVDLIAQSLLSSTDGKIEFKEKIRNFLINVLDNQTMRREMDIDEETKREKEIQKGLYVAWVIVQVKKELGIKEEI